MLARSQSTRAAVRQNEMNVNITLVTTSTCPADGPCRFGRGAVIVADEAVSGGIRGEKRIGHQQSVPVDASGVSDQVGDYNGLAARSSRGGIAAGTGALLVPGLDGGTSGVEANRQPRSLPRPRCRAAHNR